MKKNTLLIGIRTLKQFKAETLEAFKRAEAGLPGEEPSHRLYFSDQKTFLKTISPKRMELLKFLRQNGPLSIRKLASNLKRDYKNVYDDVMQLSKHKLIKKKRDQKLYVPWDDLKIDLPLAA